MKTDMKARAYLTVYLALSLTVLLSVITVLIAGIKKNTVRMEEEIALDTAGYSALAEYDRELLEQYDLFFIDTSYGGSNPETGAIGSHIKNYANKNLQNTELIDGRLTLAGIQEAEIATDYGGEVLKQQIADYEEKYFGIEMLEKLIPQAGLSEWEEIDDRELIRKRDENAAKLAEQEEPVKVTEKERYNEKSGAMETYEEEERVPIEDPAAHVNELRGKGILNLVIEDPSVLSDKAVHPEEYVSHRGDILEGTGLLQERGKEDYFLAQSKDRILLDAYIFQKYGYYGKEKENAALDYQVEYLIGKKASDVENLKAAVQKLMLLREAANAAYLYGDAGKKAEISAMAASVSAVTFAPYLQPLLETSILFAWAYIESLEDVKVLLEGGRVALVKGPADWRTDLESILNYAGEAAKKEDTEGLTYQQYLAVLLLAEKEEKLLLSMMDVMEMDIRKTAYHENFRMDGCVSGFRVAAQFEDGSGNCSFLRTFYY